MDRVLLADGAVLFQLETVGVVALIFEAVVIAVLALRALERYLHSRGFGSHRKKTPYKKITPLPVREYSLAQTPRGVNLFFRILRGFLKYFGRNFGPSFVAANFALRTSQMQSPTSLRCGSSSQKSFLRKYFCEVLLFYHL